MKLSKIHRVLKVKQSDWMKKYINFKTGKRTNAANSVENDFLKLIIKFVYSKTMKNLRKIMNARLVNKEKDFFKCTPSKHFFVFKTSSTRLQRNNFLSSKTS